MNQIDLSIFVCLAGGFPPVDVLIPLYPGILQMVETTETSYGFFEILRLVLTEKRRKQAVYDATLARRRAEAA